ncbi:unnamed protein product [Calypogeia fissa]
MDPSKPMVREIRVKRQQERDWIGKNTKKFLNFSFTSFGKWSISLSSLPFPPPSYLRELSLATLLPLRSPLLHSFPSSSTPVKARKLKNERKKLLNKLLAGKGNGQVFYRVRPEFEEEGEVITSFPNDSMIWLRIPPSGKSGPMEKQIEFDCVYAPHVGQEEIFNDVQPTIQSALDGNNVSIFAYGQSEVGKTYTLEGTSGDPSIILRAVEELFHLSNANASLAARTIFHMTMVELHDDKASDDHLNLEASLAALGDVLAVVNAKEEPPYGNSLLTSVLADSIGGDAKAVVIVNVCPCAMDLAETLASVSFGVHARNKPKSIEEDKGGEMSLEKLSELTRLEEENARLEKLGGLTY